MLWAPNELNGLLEMHFEFPFNLSLKSTQIFYEIKSSLCVVSSRS